MTEETSKQKAWGWIRDIAIGIGILLVVMAWQTSDHVRDAAPTFDLALLDSEQRISSEQLKGKPTLVYFWAPWCGVCEASSSNVSDLKEAVGDDYNVVSMVLEYRSMKSVRDFVSETHSTYPVLLGDAEQTKAWAVTSFPTIYVLDDEGAVSTSVVGYTTTLGMRARLFWAGL